ncbi:MAG: hypothetical protein K2L07_05035 [Lachnospiraceae bacterium]|nr:hypothetical protein [Lachnospiraceae bacterium]
MTKQKKGFLLFICSLLPGAGELYMGFRKMGMSITLLFWGIIACATITGFDELTFLLPVLWLYSFFNAHNLKSLSNEEFLAVEDHYILVDLLVNNEELQSGAIIKKYRSLLAGLLILFGVCGVFNVIIDILGEFFAPPSYVLKILQNIRYALPGFVISIALIVLGIKLILGKKEELLHDRIDNNK